MEAKGSPARQEFRVVIDGITLPAGTAHRITQAIRKAVLVEVATLDVKIDVGVRFTGNGGTQGIELVARKEGPV